MTVRQLLSTSVLAMWFLLLAAATSAVAQEPFYKGKTVRIIVGGSAGGGYDTYTRVIARHLGKHVPGNPNFVVENMTGAGTLISANHVYKVAKPDGLTIGHFIGGLLLQQVLGKPGIEFEGAKVRIPWCPGAGQHGYRHNQSQRRDQHRELVGDQDQPEIRRRRTGLSHRRHRQGGARYGWRVDSAGKWL